jgi:hypothetical protein
MVEVNPETLGNIEKYMEGGSLGFGAMAEVLTKMDKRLEKAEESQLARDEEEQDKEDEEEEKEQFSAMIKAITANVTQGVIRHMQKNRSFAKQDQPMAELNTDKDKKVSGRDGWPMSTHGDPETEEDSGALEASDIGTVQQPLAASAMVEAMVKAELAKKTYRKMEKTEEFDDQGDDQGDVPAVEGSEEYPMPEDEGMEQGEYSMKSMAKAFRGLSKKYDALEKNMEEKIQNETQTRLQKMGFREEKGLAGPKHRIITDQTLGSTGTNIIKSAPSSPEDTVDQLSKLSWNQLTELKYKIETGDTEGVPKELFQG